VKLHQRNNQPTPEQKEGAVLLVLFLLCLLGMWLGVP